MADKKEIVLQKCKNAIDHGKPIMDYGFYYGVLDLLKEREEIVRCKDCKHRPKVPDHKTYGDGFDIYFPEDSKCPCQCDDGYYSWYPEDDWFCANGEKKDK